MPGLGIAFITDSIGMFNSNTGEAWHRIMCSLSDGRMMWRGVFGMGGYTLAQIRDTYLPQALALTPLPGCIAICGGTNDLADDSAWPVLLEIIDLIEAAGVKPALWSLPPRNDTPSVNAAVQRWNTRLRMLAGSKNYPLFDSHSVMVDPETSLMRAGWNQDQVHPNSIGHYRIGKAFANDARLMQHFLSPGVYLSESKGSDPNLVPVNARFFDAGLYGNTGPNNWTTSGFPTGGAGSIVTDEAIPGNWLRLTRTQGTHAGTDVLVRYQATVDGAAIAVGETVSFAFRFKVHADENGAGARLWHRISCRDSTTALASVIGFTAGGDQSEGIAYAEMVVPDGCTNIRFEFSLTGMPATGVTEWAQVAQPTVLNLTRLALT